MAVDTLSRVVAGTLRDANDVDAFYLLQFQTLTGDGSGGMLINRIRPPAVVVPKYAWTIMVASFGSTNATGNVNRRHVVRVDAGLANLFAYLSVSLGSRFFSTTDMDELPPILTRPLDLPLTNDWEYEAAVANPGVGIDYTLAVVSRARPILSGGFVTGQPPGGGGGGRQNIQ